MATSGRRAGQGTRVMAVAAVLGAFVAVFNYYSPDNGIDGTGGALLVIGTTLLIAALAVLLGRPGSGRALLAGLCLILLLGTAFAAWLLNSPTLVALMAVATVGWLLLVSAHRATA